MEYEYIWSLYKSKPQRFKAVICSKSTNDDYESAILEWDMIKEEDYYFHESHCICSHDIEDNYFIKNKNNGKILVIGSECIKKFGTRDMVDEHKLMNKIANYEGDKRACINCGNHRIAYDDSWKKLCKPCYKNGIREASATYKKVVGIKSCTICGKNNNTEIEICYKCKENENKRECLSCGEKRILNTEPVWKKQCYSCYKTGVNDLKRNMNMNLN